MNERHFRVIFQGLTERAKLQRLVSFFHKELGMSEDEIRAYLTSPPRVLWHLPSRDDATRIQEALENMGCITYVDPLVTHAEYPFALSEAHHQMIKREFSKVLRVQSTLALFLVQVAPSSSGRAVPSLMGDVQEQLENRLRESDTIIGVDDFRVIILGFSTNGHGVDYVEHKVKNALKAVLTDDVPITIGHAVFPSEAGSLQALLKIAETRRTGASIAERYEKGHETGEYVSSTEAHRESPPPDRCMLKARGKAFQRLTNMDPEILWLGLGQFSFQEQKRFSQRLPFDSPMVTALNDVMNQGRRPTPDKDAEQHLQAVVHQIELDGGAQNGRKERKREILDHLKKADALPTLSSIAAQIFTIASNRDASAEDITKVIVNDPPLTSKLLKIVNSAFYGFPQKVSTVKQAVVIMGTEEIIDLSFGLAAAKAFEVEPIEGLDDPKDLWRHAICTGFIAQDLCKNLPKYQNLGPFTAGLLHDLGKIFLIDNYADIYAKLRMDSTRHEIPVFEMEEEWLGLSHAFVGQSLVTGWNLPQALCNAIAYHHEPFAASAHHEFAAVVGLADYLYYQTDPLDGLNTGETTDSSRLTLGHWQILEDIFHNLTRQRLDDMVRQATRVVEESQGLFSLLEAA